MVINMRRIIFAPSRYIQGNGEIKELATHVASLGKKPFILVDPYILENYGDYIKSSFTEDVKLTAFTGECSFIAIDNLVNNAIGDEDVLVGIGGGKTIDTAKAVAIKKNIPMIICPTAASSDAPCSSLSVVYTEDGVYEDVLYYTKNPDIVLVDTDIVAKAPARLLVTGMGDALATFYEMRSNYRADKNVIAGGKVSRTAYAVAETCKDILLEKGYIALQSAKNKTLTTAFEDVIEANTYMSGLGFESGGVAVAHGVHDALTILDETHHLLHGEKVAFGTICQLVIENAPKEEITEIIDFCKSVGLPTNLKDLGIVSDIEEKIRKVAQTCDNPLGLVYNCPFEVTPDLIYGTIMTVNELGK